MKKMFLMLLVAALTAFSNVEAQTSNNFLEEIKKANLLEGDVLKKLSELSMNLNGKAKPMAKSKAKAAEVRASEVPFTERVRVPEASMGSKYWYLRNVVTGEYMHYEDPDSALKTVDTLDAAAQFYFVNRTAGNTGNGVTFYNKNCTNTNSASRRYFFYGPGENKWGNPSTGLLDFSSNYKTFYFHVAEVNGKRGFYISDNSTAGKGNVWRYDPDEKNIGIGSIDEYALWECIAVPVAPQLSTAADTVWYVVKNNGKYLHYEGANKPMSTVVAPDSCSLFYALSTENGIELHNYTAGELVCQATDSWSKTGSNFNIKPIEDGGLQYYISVSGDKTENDIWFVGDNGLLQSGANGENFLWEFEEITNFKEIFGLSSNGYLVQSFTSAVTDAANKIYSSQSVSVYKAYSVVLAVLIGALGDKAYIGDFSTVQSEYSKYNSILKFFSHINFVEVNEDIKIYNIGHVDTSSGDTIVNAMTTNSTLLEINNAENAHTNVWQMTAYDITSSNPKLVMYNRAVNKYLGKPSVENGVATVSLVPDLNDAGTWMFNLDSISVKDDFMTDLIVMGAIRCGNEGYNNYYLKLSSPMSKEIVCQYYDNDEAAAKDKGTMWLLKFGDAAINAKFYQHAADAAAFYPQFLQSNYGLVKEDGECENVDDHKFYSEYHESTMEISDLCHLTDCNINTAFGTQMACDHSVHTLQVALPEQVSEFYFYMKPFTGMVYGVPLSMTVEGYKNGSDDPVFVKTVDTSSMYDNMYYFSGLINEDGEAVDYLSFTVNETNSGPGYPAYALSEFYVLPNNEKVAEASLLINEFYSKNHMGEEIIEPAVELVKLKAEYYLEVKKDQHSEIPIDGMYSTEKYNALQEACDNVKANDSDSVDKLIVALDEFLNSQYSVGTYPIYMFSSAWEDGYTNGWAMGVCIDNENGNKLPVNERYMEAQQANIWDMRQWVVADRHEGGSYDLYVLGLQDLSNGLTAIPAYIEEINGWNTLYSSNKMAYNIYSVNNGKTYLALYKDGAEDIIITGGDVPATTTANKEAAWYLTTVGYATISDYASVMNLYQIEFIEALADFGKSFALAEQLRAGEKKGRYVYENNNGLTKSDFEDLYSMLKPYYNNGPFEICKKFVSGEYSYALLIDIMGVLGELKDHFPNFKDNSSTSGMYYRMKGKASGNYVVAALVDGTLKMMSAEVDGYDEISSVFYSTLTQNENYVQDVISYSNGRYIKAEDGKVKYDAIPKYEETYTMQGCAFGWTENGYTLLLDGEHMLLDGGTAVTSKSVTAIAEGGATDNSYWEMEVVEKLPVKITDAGVASFYAPVELVIPEGVKAYVLYGEDKTENNSHMDVTTGQMYEAEKNVFNLKSLQGGVIPAGLPVLLTGDAGVYNFHINYERTLITDEDVKATYCYDEDIVNLLEGVVPTTYIPVRDNYIHYILSRKNAVVGMYKVKTYTSLTSSDDKITTTFDKESFQNNGHRAWLPMPAAQSNGAASYQFAVGYKNDGTTGIVENVKDENEEDVIYDLAGRRLEKVTARGIYIINGKRVFVK